jgi:hypothetical protein
MKNEWWQQYGEALGQMFAKYGSGLHQMTMPGGLGLYEWRVEYWTKKGLVERHREVIQEGNGFSIERAASEIERVLG